MTISINGNDVMEIVQIAATIGSIAATLIVGFIIYLMVRPSRRERARPEVQPADPRESEETSRAMDRMTERLAVLERALADRIERPRDADDGDRLFAAADLGRDSGRKE